MDAAMPRILLVEDDPDVRPLLEHILQTEAGYSVTSAESLTIGLRLIAEQPFDLLITDVNLPDGSGLRLADKAKELGVPAVVLTGYGLSLKPGTLSAYDYLLKPVRPPELLKAIRERLSRDEGRGKLVPFPGQGQ